MVSGFTSWMQSCTVGFFVVVLFLPAILIICYHICLSNFPGSMRRVRSGILYYCILVPGFWDTVSPHRPIDGCYCSHQLVMKTWRLHVWSLCTVTYDSSYFHLANGKRGVKAIQLIARPSQVQAVLSVITFSLSLRQGLHVDP